jgi:hypothetical protein
MLFACRFYDLMTPDKMAREMEDEDGKSWWPKTWKAPLAFVNTLWQLTPPKKLKKGHHDLLHEALNLERQHGGICKVRRRRGKDPAKRRTKRATPQNAKALLSQVEDLGDRFRSIWQQVVGKDQMQLNQLYGRWHQAREEARSLTDGTDYSSGSGSESTGSSDARASKAAAANQYIPGPMADKITEVADELNHIEDNLQQLEATHRVVTHDGGYLDVGASTGVNTEQGGTSMREPPETPYMIMKLVVGTHIFCWAFLLLGTGIEIVLGTESLAQPPGEPPWIRNMKLRVYQPDKTYLHLSTDPLPEWYRLFVAATLPEPSAHGSAHGGQSDSHSGDHGSAAADHSSGSADHSSAAVDHSGADHSSAGMSGDADHSSAHGSHRRLTSGRHQGAEAFSDLLSALPALDWLAEKYLKDDDHSGMAVDTASDLSGMPTTMADMMDTEADPATVPANGFMAPSLRVLPVEWPFLFEPRHLACQTRATGAAVAALAPRGFGALLHLKNGTHDTEGKIKAEQFALAGISAFGPLVGASWGSSGLHLVTKAGHLLHCPGHVPSEGAWPCQPDTAGQIPMSPGSMLRAGVVTDHAVGERTLALLYEDTPTVVVLYKEDANRQAWLPAGEMHLPPGSRHATLSLARDELVIVLEDGAVHHRPLSDKAFPSMVPAAASSIPREWHSACAASVTGELGEIRLAMRQSGLSSVSAWTPELVVAANMHASPTPLLNV